MEFWIEVAKFPIFAYSMAILCFTAMEITRNGYPIIRLD